MKKIKPVKACPKKIARAVARTLIRSRGWGAIDTDTGKHCSANFGCWEADDLATWFVQPIRRAMTPVAPKPKRRARK